MGFVGPFPLDVGGWVPKMQEEGKQTCNFRKRVGFGGLLWGAIFPHFSTEEWKFIKIHLTCFLTFY